ncbi:unnamed protein product [Blepharisma stoltei]|uniref:Uncharacterized protein n=1 Tax=Blepharisma stoltei TaxID=1481888 RepID=A0AAU9JM76_9CILI|nr:unnamed protein product [Blepharisma stoltei]
MEEFEANIPLSTIDSQPYLESESVPRVSVTLRPASSSGSVKSGRLNQSTQSLKKIPSITVSIEDLLQAQHAGYKAKLNLKILEKESQEAAQLKEKPLINPKSRRMAEARRSLDLQNEKESAKRAERDKLQSFRAMNSYISLESLKKSLTARSKSVSEIPTPKKNYLKMSVVDRVHSWFEEKQKKIETQRRQSFDNELVGCTFQPELSPRIPIANSSESTNDQKLSLKRTYSYSSKKPSKSLDLQKDKNYTAYCSVTKKGIPLRIPPPNSSRTLTRTTRGSSKDMSSPILSQFYSQLTPYHADYRFKSGFNSKAFLLKAKPMVDYTF